MALHGPAPARRGVRAVIMGFRADGGGVEQHLRAHQRHGTRGFGEPLVPANANAHAAEHGIPYLEAGIAGPEVILLLIAGAIGDMALAVGAKCLAVRVQHDQRVVIARAVAFEDGDRDHHTQLGRKRLQRGHARMLQRGIGRAKPALFWLVQKYGP